MQRKILVVLAAVVALSMLACGLTERVGNLTEGLGDLVEGIGDLDMDRLGDLVEGLGDLDLEGLGDLVGELDGVTDGLDDLIDNLDDFLGDLGDIDPEGDIELPPSISLGELPEGYPRQEFPIYEGTDATILGGGKHEVDDTVFYNVVVGTNDDEQIVRQNIRAMFEEASDEFEEMLGGGMFIGVKDGWQYAIVVSGESDGYQALITYALERK